MDILLAELRAFALDPKGIAYMVQGVPFLTEDIAEADSDGMLEHLVQSRLAQRGIGPIASGRHQEISENAGICPASPKG